MKDGSVCTGCTVLDYSNNNFMFNVTGFTTYSSASNSKLSVNVVDDNSKIIVGEMVRFDVNYSNRTSGLSINGSGLWCNISFNGTYTNISFNSTSHFYYYKRNFSDRSVKSYSQAYNVSCLGNSLNYEDLNLSSSFDVELNHSFLTLNQSLEGVSESSLVFGDTNNDSRVDLVLSGSNATNILKIYRNNGTWFVFNEDIVNYGASLGSLSLVDYDKDDDLDISQTGENNDDQPEARLFKYD